jgi:uncharacterized RDD family membrane protein YckC
MAMAIDLGLITIVVFCGASLTRLVGALLPSWFWLTAALPAAVTAVMSFVPLAYFFLTVAIAGVTPGKAVMGLRIERPDGRRLGIARSLLRTIAYLVSLAPLFAGFLWVLVDTDRRTWHDHIAGSRVVFGPPRGMSGRE